jgi:integrase
MPKQTRIPKSTDPISGRVKALKRGVWTTRKVGSVGKKDAIGYRLFLGYDKKGNAVQKRVGKVYKKAEEIRVAWNRAIERNDIELGQGALHMPTKDVQDALALLKDHPEVTLTECVRKYVQNFLPPDSKRLTMKEASERYIEIQKEKQLSAVSTDIKGSTYRTYYKPFFTKYASMKLVDFTPKDASDWFSRPRCKKWAARTWNGHRNRLTGFWSVMADNRYCGKKVNPFETIVYKSVKSVRNSARVSDHVKAKKYLRWLEEECRKYPSKYPELALVVITWFVGIRVEEVGRVGWDSLNKKARHLGDLGRADYTGWSITVWGEHEKTQTDKVNPVPENAKFWLELCERNWKRKSVKDKCEGKRFAARDQIQLMKKLRTKFREETKITLPTNSGRHSFLSMHLALYGDKKLTVERAGHGSDADTLERYYKAGMDSLDAKAYFDIIPKVTEKRLAKEAEDKADADDKAAYEDALFRSSGADPIRDDDGKWQAVTSADY